MRLSLEVIDFQKDGFKALDIVVESLVKHASSCQTKEEFVTLSETKEVTKLLENTLFKRFNINYQIVLDTGAIGAVVIFPINKNVPLLPARHRGFKDKTQDRLIDMFDNKRGSIDNEHAKVGGIFSTYVHNLYIDIFSNVKELGLTTRELGAIILHEVGHTYTYYEFSDKIDATNRVLSDISAAIKDGKTDVMHYKFKELSKELDEDEDYFDDVANASNKTIMGMKFFKKYAKYVGTQMSNVKYTETASEQLADNFAARFGYGRDLIIGLDKLYSKYTPDRNNKIYYTLETITLFWIALRPVVFVAVTMFSIPLGVLYGIFVLVVMFMMGTENMDYTYDNVYTRYDRIRHQLIALLKLQDLNKEDTASLLRQIDTIDEIVNSTRDYTSIATVISDFIYTRHSEAKEQVLLEKVLEKLAHNDLFTMSARFDTI